MDLCTVEQYKNRSHEKREKDNPSRSKIKKSLKNIIAAAPNTYTDT